MNLYDMLDLWKELLLDKARQVLSNLGGNGKLKIFKADLDEEGSFDEAVKGCIGVFHVAASMEFNCDANQNIGNSLIIIF